MSAIAHAAPAKRNVVFILVDDMRYDAMGFMGYQFIKTPAIDKLAAGGVHFRNAFVTTSLCSPSRASFLTGLYAHKHGIMDNSTRIDPSIPTFPVLLQKAGYRTAFVGKWHMGGSTDEPRPGFDYWASFKGQGDYFVNDFNINGQQVKIDEYVTDAITRLGTDWLRSNHGGPFMLYMSHKAVHDAFWPPERYKETFAEAEFVPPASMADTPENYFRKPKWVREQRDSWHGVNDMYHKWPNKHSTLRSLVRNYIGAMLAVDDSIAALVKTLKKLNLFDSTLIILAGDNGFLLGEHGLIDKRCMYAESIRIPWIASCPEMYGSSGKTVDKMILNIDLAPTIMEAAGVSIPKTMQGRSALNLPNQPDMPWRTAFVYEYFWEKVYPETPTCLGIRTDNYKYIEYHGVWDANELYDIRKDPKEVHNLISTSRHKKVMVDSGYEKVYSDLRHRLGVELDRIGARSLPTWKK
jgi:N-acetylglucosamine-6-sulfatase